jgi:hypothetical protein
LLKQFPEEELFDKPLTVEQVKQILALMEMKEEDIDLSDIPELTEIPKDAQRGLFYRGPRITLKPDLHRYFRELADRKRLPLNDLVNETLKKALAITEVTR